MEMIFGTVLIIGGVLLLIGAAKLSTVLKVPNEQLGARGPSRLSFILVGAGFIIVGLASVLGWA